MKGIAILISLVLLTAFGGARMSYGQGRTKKEDASMIKGVQFSIEMLDCGPFKRDDVITVKFSFKNTNKSRVYLYKHLGFGIGGFRISILDSNKRHVPRNFIAENFPSAVWTKEDFMAIEPGKSFEDQFQISLRFYEIERGDYSLIVSFLSPVPSAVDVPSGLLILTSDDFFEVKPIRFKVLP